MTVRGVQVTAGRGQTTLDEVLEGAADVPAMICAGQPIAHSV